MKSGICQTSTGSCANGPINTRTTAHNVPHSAQHFAAAVQALIADGPIKQRLTIACAEHLADLTETELPAAVRSDFAGLQAAVSRVAPAGSESRVSASVRKMSTTEAVGHAESTLRLAPLSLPSPLVTHAIAFGAGALVMLVAALIWFAITMKPITIERELIQANGPTSAQQN